MDIDRRRLLTALAGTAGVVTAAPAALARDGVPRASIDATTFGLQPNVADDQSKIFQRAIDSAAAARAVLQLAPGFYRAGGLQLPSFAAISGVPGATRVLIAAGPSIMSASGSDQISVSGLVLDGSGIPLPERRGLLHFAHGRSVRVAECEIVNSGRNGITLEAIEGKVTGNAIGAADVALDRYARVAHFRQHGARRREQRHPGLAQRAGR